MNGKQECDAGRRRAGSEAELTLKERLQEVEGILDIGARRYVESRQVPPPTTSAGADKAINDDIADRIREVQAIFHTIACRYAANVALNEVAATAPPEAPKDPTKR